MSTPAATKIVSVLMPLELVKAIEDEAKKHERTVSQEIRLALKAHIAPPKRQAS